MSLFFWLLFVVHVFGRFGRFEVQLSPFWWYWVFLRVLIGVLSFFGQITLVCLAQFETASTTALLRKSIDIILAFVFQIVFFGVSNSFIFFFLQNFTYQFNFKFLKGKPGLLKICGTIIISFAIITSSLKKVFNSNSEKWMKYRLLQLLFSHSKVAEI